MTRALELKDNLDKHEVGVALYHRLWAINAVDAPDHGGHRAQVAERIVAILCRLYDVEPDRIDRTGVPLGGQRVAG